MTMDLEKLLLQIFRIIIAVLFIFSAISKLLSLSFFDGLVAELIFGKSYYTLTTELFYTQLLTRVIIAGEFVLGLAVLQNRYLKSIVLPAIMVMLVMFNIHLTFEGLEKGFIGGNCGCFGDLVPMDIFESIMKNIVTMLMVGFVWLKYKERYVFDVLIVPFLTGGVILGTLLLTIKSYEKVPEIETYQNTSVELITQDSSSVSQGELVVGEVSDTLIKPEDVVVTEDVEKPEVIEVSTKKEPVVSDKYIAPSIYAPYKKFSNGQVVDLDQGNKLICMFSLTCGHCQQAYKELCQMNEKGDLPEIYLITYGSSFDLNHFFSKANCKHPYILIEDYNEFKHLLGEYNFPKIVHSKNGAELKMWHFDTYSQTAARTYFNIPEVKEKSNEIDVKSSFDTNKEEDIFGEKKPWE